MWLLLLADSSESVDMTVKELEENLKEGMTAGGSSSKNLGQAKVVSIASDVCDTNDVKKLANFAINKLGSVDIWINNAGINKGFRLLLQFNDEGIKQIWVNKVRLRQFHASLLKECKRSNVGIHTASPGMVLTDLLLSGSTIKNKRTFSIICELPETVARSLVPRMRVVKGTGKAINYLTPPRILLALVTAWLRQGRWFDEQGRALYAAEADRIRNWAENHMRFSFTDAMDMYTENTWGLPLKSWKASKVIHRDPISEGNRPVESRALLVYFGIVSCSLVLWG
ncbi:hypothetical protein CRYUN_Cryun26dG0066100 [Craigia yunnanensis]